MEDYLHWECPDLFELPLDNGDGTTDTRWVLEVDIGGGAIAGGSGGEYFVGDFDGTTFRAEQAARWVDYGRDFYAPVSYDNIPPADGRRIWIGWPRMAHASPTGTRIRRFAAHHARRS